VNEDQDSALKDKMRIWIQEERLTKNFVKDKLNHKCLPVLLMKIKCHTFFATIVLLRILFMNNFLPFVCLFPFILTRSTSSKSGYAIRTRIRIQTIEIRV
jgi:hypothetical protein